MENYNSEKPSIRRKHREAPVRVDIKSLSVICTKKISCLIHFELSVGHFYR